eukprot:g13737.t1
MNRVAGGILILFASGGAALVEARTTATTSTTLPPQTNPGVDTLSISVLVRNFVSGDAAEQKVLLSDAVSATFGIFHPFSPAPPAPQVNASSVVEAVSAKLLYRSGDEDARLRHILDAVAASVAPSSTDPELGLMTGRVLLSVADEPFHLVANETLRDRYLATAVADIVADSYVIDHKRVVVLSIYELTESSGGPTPLELATSMGAEGLLQDEKLLVVTYCISAEVDTQEWRSSLATSKATGWDLTESNPCHGSLDRYEGHILANTPDLEMTTIEDDWWCSETRSWTATSVTRMKDADFVAPFGTPCSNEYERWGGNDWLVCGPDANGKTWDEDDFEDDWDQFADSYAENELVASCPTQKPFLTLYDPF